MPCKPKLLQKVISKQYGELKNENLFSSVLKINKPLTGLEILPISPELNLGTSIPLFNE